ncbi:MAG TPA: Hpt domain-containing protein, partial [Bdellovibrionales bacterium]|nr:Hpt domain-containing protein [Bdellovibrionales bacterium]
MDDILKEFITEANDLVAGLEENLVRIEREPQNRDLLNQIFRSIHTIKGTCGMFGFGRIEKVSHAAEELLTKMRDGQLPVTPESINLVLHATDVIRQILLGLSQGEAKEPAGDDGQLVQALVEAAAGRVAKFEVGGAAVSNGGSTASEQSLRVNVEILDLLMNLVGELVLTRNQLLQLSQAEEGSPYIGA